MATEQKLILELIRAKHINAKREKEALPQYDANGAINAVRAEWYGQEIMAQQILTILEG